MTQPTAVQLEAQALVLLAIVDTPYSDTWCADICRTARALCEALLAGEQGSESEAV